MRDDDSVSSLTVSPTPLHQRRIELAAQIIHRRTSPTDGPWDRLHPDQQDWYRDIARSLLRDVDALMQEER